MTAHLRPVPTQRQSVELSDIDAEREVLGAAMLTEPAHALAIVALVADADWSVERHRDIARAMRIAAESGQDIEPVAVSLAMKAQGTYELHGGARCLGELYERAGTIGNVEHYAAIVREKARLRRMLDVSSEIQAAVVAGDDVAEVVARTRTRLDEVGEAEEVELTHAQRVQAYVAEVERPTALRPRLSTSLPALDTRINGGMVRGWLVVVQAAGKVGKTVLSANGFIPAVCGDLMHPGSAHLVSLEMSLDEHMARWLARETGGHVPVCAQENRNLSPAQWGSFNGAADRVARWRLSFDDRARSVDAIAASAHRAAKLHGGLDLLVVDGLTQVSNPGMEGNRTLDIDRTTRGLKQLGVDLDCVVALTVHVDKASAVGGKPGMYDARGSSGPANDANLLLVPFRDPETPERAGLRIFGRSVAQDEMGLGTLRFDGARMAFVEAR